MTRLPLLSLLIVPLALVACSDSGAVDGDDSTSEAGDTGDTTDAVDEDESGDTSDTSDTGSTSDTSETETDGNDTDGPCENVPVTPSQVVMLGDSYLALTQVPANVFNLARVSGALGDDEEYRRYDQGGTQMGNGQIPAQFDQAFAADPDINTVIMTGGGNDVLIGDASTCLQNPPPNETCVERIDDVLDAASNLLQTMADSGVENVVYFFYPHLPDGGLVGGAKNEVLDYAAPLVQSLCEDAPLNCVFVDTRPAFEGHPEYFQGDGIHPNGAGSVALANAVWSAMVVNCIAQEQP